MRRYLKFLLEFVLWCVPCMMLYQNNVLVGIIFSLFITTINAIRINKISKKSYNDMRDVMAEMYEKGFNVAMDYHETSRDKYNLKLFDANAAIKGIVNESKNNKT